MADNGKPTPTNLELLTKTMNELAQPDDPKRTAWRRVLSNLTEVRIFLKSRRDELIAQRMDELAGEITSVKIGDSRRAQIIQEIMRLSDLLNQS